MPTKTMTKAKKKPTVAQLRQEFEKATKLSKILAIALHDFAIAEKMKNVQINMGVWYENGSEICQVCLGGAVMRGRYKSVCQAMVRKREEYREAYPEDLQCFDAAAQKIKALNRLRVGNVSEAAEYLGVVAWDDIKGAKKVDKLDRNVHDYHDDRDLWWADMKQLVKDLKEAGL
jgi:hypothetical protein